MQNMNPSQRNLLSERINLLSQRHPTVPTKRIAEFIAKIEKKNAGRVLKTQDPVSLLDAADRVGVKARPASPKNFDQDFAKAFKHTDVLPGKEYGVGFQWLPAPRVNDAMSVIADGREKTGYVTANENLTPREEIGVFNALSTLFKIDMRGFDKIFIDTPNPNAIGEAQQSLMYGAVHVENRPTPPPPPPGPYNAMEID